MGIDARIFAVLHDKPTDQQITRWSYELAVCFPDSVWHNQEHNRRALFLTTEHDINTDKPVLEVSTLMRYYSIGYERGPLPTIIMIAEWLERGLHAEVYYGGDSGVYPRLFTKDERDKLFDYFINNIGTTRYSAGWHGKQAPMCSFDNERMWCTSAGPYDRYTFKCPACELTQTIDNNPPDVQETYKSWIKETA